MKLRLKQKFLSALLAVCMAFSLMPANVVFAANNADIMLRLGTPEPQEVELDLGGQAEVSNTFGVLGEVPEDLKWTIGTEELTIAGEEKTVGGITAKLNENQETITVSADTVVTEAVAIKVAGTVGGEEKTATFLVTVIDFKPEYLVPIGTEEWVPVELDLQGMGIMEAIVGLCGDVPGDLKWTIGTEELTIAGEEKNVGDITAALNKDGNTITVSADAVVIEPVEIKAEGTVDGAKKTTIFFVTVIDSKAETIPIDYMIELGAEELQEVELDLQGQEKVTSIFALVGRIPEDLKWTIAQKDITDNGTTTDDGAITAILQKNGMINIIAVSASAVVETAVEITASGTMGDSVKTATFLVTVKDSGSETPEPTTSEPTTSEPTTSEPTTSEPTTSEPTTSEPTTSEPTTSEPTTSEPTTSEPTTSEPTTSEPTTSEPTTSEPTTSEPTTSEPTTSEPTTSEPTTSEPSTSEPTTSEPTTSEPTTSEPTTSEPTTSEPTTSEPSTSEPTTSEPTTSEPTTSEPTTSEPTTSEPTTSEPTTSEPTTSEPTTSEPTTSEPSKEEPVAVTDVSLNKASLKLQTGKSKTLKAAVAPNNAADKTVTWKTSDKKVATVSSSGKVTAVEVGTATITVTTKDGGRTATCKVTVTGISKKASDGTKVEITNTKKKEVAYVAPKTKKSTVKVPETVKVGGKTYKVTSIDAGAFKKNTKVTKVTIGKNIEEIGKDAFSGCTKLKSVKFGPKVTKIGANAFKGCKAMTSVTIGKNVTEIASNAFNGCSRLKAITIKSTKLKTVGKNAFKGISTKAVIKVPKNKLSAYKKLLKNKGQKSSVKIKK